MPMNDAAAAVRILLSSKDKIIGQCTLTREKLLAGRPNQAGIYVVRDHRRYCDDCCVL